MATPANPNVVPAGGQMKIDGNEKDAAPATCAAALPVVPPAATQGKPPPIDLPTALTLSDSNPLDIQIAGERLRAATAQFDRARILWLPNVGVGPEGDVSGGEVDPLAQDAARGYRQQPLSAWAERGYEPMDFAFVRRWSLVFGHRPPSRPSMTNGTSRRPQVQ